MPERIHVVHKSLRLGVHGRVHGAHALLQECGVVDALGARKNFLAAHVEIVGVAVAVEGIIREALDVGRVRVGSGGRHGIEGANGEGVLV